MKILLFANTDWYLYNFRLELAKVLRDRGDQVVLVSPGGPYASRLQELGYRWLSFPMQRDGMNPWIEMGTIARLVRLYLAEKPDLAHHFTVKCVLYGSLACSLTGIRRVVNSVTGLGYVYMENGGRRRWLQGLITAFYRLVLRKTRVIFQNPDDRDTFLERRLVEPAQVALIRGSGVDLEKFSPQPEPPGPPLVILPARLLWDKGVGDFVAAARLLRVEQPHLRFALVGDSDPGNPAAVPEVQLQAWVQEGVLEWWGWHDDMDRVYAQAHVICLPSFREGLPKTLVEAAGSGRPIVASDVPGCREIVHAGENGLLVPVRDVPALARAVNRLIQDPALRKEMGVNGRKLAGEFSMDRIISETLQVYQSSTGSAGETKK